MLFPYSEGGRAWRRANIKKSGQMAALILYILWPQRGLERIGYVLVNLRHVFETRARL
jgi:hypothetical protein